MRGRTEPPPEIDNLLDLDPFFEGARAIAEVQERERRRETARTRAVERTRPREAAAAREEAHAEYLRWVSSGGRGQLSPALDLIRTVCTPAEWEEFRKERKVTLRGRDGHTYIVHPFAHTMVESRNPEGKHLARYCVVFRNPDLPPGDEVAMKIADIKADLPAFLKAAHRFS